MSNIYKWQYTVAEENTRIINSNEMLRERFAAEAANAPAQAVPSGELSDGALPEEGFSEGLAAQEVEVVPQESASELLEQAKEEAEQIKSNAVAEAEQILRRAKEEAGHMKETACAEGRQSGYDEGMANAQAEAERLRAELADARDAQEQEYKQRLRAMEPELMQVVISVFDKVFHTAFSDDKDILLYLIQHAVQGIKDSREYRVRVSAADYEFMQQHRGEIMQRVGGEIALDILCDETMTQGQCEIDTDEGIFDCSVDVQLGNLVKDLKMLSSAE